MEQYKEKLKMQNLTIAVCSLALAAFSFLSAAGEMGIIGFMQPAAGDSHWQSAWRGFILGAACGIMAFMIIGLVRNICALRDEKKLKKLYIQAHDERQIQIWTAARAAATQTALLVGIVAGVVAGYFHMVVSITILACTVCHALITIGFKIYYSRKF